MPPAPVNRSRGMRGIPPPLASPGVDGAAPTANMRPRGIGGVYARCIGAP